ncbi:MAG: ankyrin repeat domain-containing protein [Planctomycetota bacterium]
MPDTESFIQALEQGPLHELAALLSNEPRRMNTFLSQPASHGAEQWMPMHYAARAGHLAGVETLLERGVHPDCRTRFATPMHARQTPLHLVAVRGHVDVAKRLIEAGAEVEVRDAQQRSPLWFAARHGHAELVTLFARRGAALEARDTQQRTPLHAALLPPKLRTSAPIGSAAERLGLSAAEGSDFDPAAALVLLEADADVNATCPKEPEGFTPLHRCVTLGEAALPVARALVERDADRTATDPRHGRTAFDLAQHLDQADYVELLSA